jgi:hypothetical protein
MYKMMYILSRNFAVGLRCLFSRGSWIGAGETVLPESRIHVSPPFSLRLSRLRPEGAIHSQECCEIAGSWGLRGEGIQPETARFCPIGREKVGSSLGAGAPVGWVHRISRKCVFKTLCHSKLRAKKSSSTTTTGSYLSLMAAN